MQRSQPAGSPEHFNLRFPAGILGQKRKLRAEYRDSHTTLITGSMPLRCRVRVESSIISGYFIVVQGGCQVVGSELCCYGIAAVDVDEVGCSLGHGRHRSDQCHTKKYLQRVDKQKEGLKMRTIQPTVKVQASELSDYFIRVGDLLGTG